MNYQQNLVPCENGQHIKIENDISNTITISEDYGEIINNSNEYIYLNIIFFAMFFYFCYNFNIYHFNNFHM